MVSAGAGVAFGIGAMGVYVALSNTTESTFVYGALLAHCGVFVLLWARAQTWRKQ